MTKSINEVTRIYNTWINANGLVSMNTQNLYLARSREFFEIVLDKKVGEISKKDLINIKAMDVQDYVTSLRDKGNSASTIRTKLRSMRSLWKDLKRNEVKVDAVIFDVKLGRVEEKITEGMTMEELEGLYKFIESERELRLEKRLLVKFMVTTAIRSNASINNLKWTDIVQKRDKDTGKMVWVVDVRDKASKLTNTPITDEFYNELKQLDKGQERVFSCHPDTLRNLLKKYSKVIGKDIKVHGLKASAITIAYEKTRDLNACKLLGKHESISVTQRYINDEESYTKQLSYALDISMDESKLDELSHEELLKIVKEDISIKTKLLMKLAS